MPVKKNKYGIDLGRCTVQHQLLCYGIHTFTCLSEAHPGPLGTVWVHVYGGRKVKTAFVLDSYVPPWARRAGVRTLINKEILKQCHRIVSSDASQKDGMAFMKAAGYRHDKNMGMMVLGGRK